MKDLDATKQTADPILVVDDEPVIVSLLQGQLEHAGYSTVGLTNPLQALEELKRQTFSVIVSDQRMPELPGLELLAQASQIQPNATRILVTAVTDLDTVIEAINK